MLLASAQKASGDDAAAKTVAEKAIKSAGVQPGLLNYVLVQVKKYEAESKAADSVGEKKDK